MLRAWFLHRPGQRSRGHGRVQRPGRSRSLVTEMESLEGRALLTATSAVSWLSGLVTHHAFYAIAPNDSVEVSFGRRGTFKSPGGYAKQISATMDSTVYTISGDNAVYENSGGVWVPRGGYAKQISASLDASGKPEGLRHRSQRRPPGQPRGPLERHPPDRSSWRPPGRFPWTPP